MRGPVFYVVATNICICIILGTLSYDTVGIFVKGSENVGGGHEASFFEEQLGRHLIVEMMGSPVEALNNISFVDTVFREACRVGSLTLLKMQLHKFEPQGVSGVAVLAESHISIHTWPEKSYAALDIFVCGENADPDLALNHIKTRFEATTLNTRRLKRGIPKLSSSTEL